jgi:hypothetical protein
VRCHLVAGREMTIASIQFQKLRCTEVVMVIPGLNGYTLQARLTHTVNCTLQS